jgi:hypothetical protein
VAEAVTLPVEQRLPQARHDHRPSHLAGAERHQRGRRPPVAVERSGGLLTRTAETAADEFRGKEPGTVARQVAG